MGIKARKRTDKGGPEKAGDKVAGLQAFLEAFKRLENGASGPAWLRPVRQAAIERSAELGFPTPKDEDWKFTNVSPIARRRFELDGGDGAEVTAEQLEPFAFGEAEAARLVFVNGRYAPGLSRVGTLPKGVLVMSLSEAFEREPELVEANLARHQDYERDFFSALNTAFMQDGGFVHVPDGVLLEGAVHLLYVATATPAPVASHPRNLIIAGTSSQAAVAEEYITLGGEEYFSNVVTEAVAGDNAALEHYVIERESGRAYNVGTLRIQQGRASNVSSHAALFGGSLVRNNVHPVLAGEGAHCLVNGLFMPRQRQHMDNFMRVEHASPHGDSRQFYTGILDDRGRGVFSGRIVVHKAAQRTDAKQTNRNLLLSDDAQVDSKPQLEIYADDVKCTHGATIGQLDPQAIFYLRSRGIDERAARALLLFGFAAENLERMKSPLIRRYVENLVIDRLPEAKTLESLM